MSVSEGSSQSPNGQVATAGAKEAFSRSIALASSVGIMPDRTVGGDGSPIHLSALTPADLKGAAMAHGLKCSFSTPDAGALLIAHEESAITLPARGVVKILDSVEQVVGRTSGAVGAISGGATFVGQGKVIRIAMAGKNPIESSDGQAYPATLTYDRADGARRVVLGLWTCGAPE
jgi:hypothetical protein